MLRQVCFLLASSSVVVGVGQSRTTLGGGLFLARSELVYASVPVGFRLEGAQALGPRTEWTLEWGASVPVWENASFVHIYDPRTLASGSFDTANANVHRERRTGLLFAEIGARLLLHGSKGSVDRCWHAAVSLEGARWQVDQRGTAYYHAGGERTFANRLIVQQVAMRLGFGRRFPIARRRIDASLSIRLRTWNQGWYASGRSGQWLEMPMVNFVYVFIA